MIMQIGKTLVRESERLSVKARIKPGDREWSKMQNITLLNS